MLILAVLISSASAVWPNGYTYRREIAITGSTGAGTYYQVPVWIGQDGTVTNCNFTLEDHGQADFDDVRFTASDGTTYLPHWREYVTGGVGKFWVNVSADLGSARDIYIYYGNATAVNASNGNQTFIFFDNFTANLDRWTVGQGTWVVSSYLSDNRANVTSNVAYDNLYHDTGLTQYAMNMKISKTTNQRYAGFILRRGDNGNYYAAYLDYFGNTIRIVRYSAWVWGGYVVSTAKTLFPLVWYDMQFDMVGNVFNLTVSGTKLTGGDGMSAGNTSVGLWAYEARPTYYDDFRVRKFVWPEPAFSVAGAEEEYGLVITGYVKDYYTSTVLKNVLCTLNVTSETTYTNSAGYYNFSGLNSSLDYFIHAYRGDYKSNNSAVVTTLPAHNTNITLLSFKLPKATTHIPNISEEAYDEFSDALGSGNWTENLFNWSGAMTALSMPYTAIMGNLFLLLLFSAPFLMAWIRTGSTAIPTVWGLIFGSAVLIYLPSSYRLTAVLILVLSIVGGLWMVFKERF